MTAQLVLHQVDVFAEEMLTGNAAMVVFGGSTLTDCQMLSIAREINLSETVFVLEPVNGGDYRIRTFTTRREIPFSGHPSLAAAHAYSNVLSSDSLELTQEDGHGLTILRRQHANADWFLELPRSRISPAPTPAGYGIGALFDTRDYMFVGDTPYLASAGVRWLVLEVPNEDDLHQLQPDHRRIAAWSVTNGAVGVAVFARTDATGVDAHLRSFAPSEGIYEDPVCGSCAGAIATVLATKPEHSPAFGSYVFLQGKCVNRPGRMTVRLHEDGLFHLGGPTVSSIVGFLHIR